MRNILKTIILLFFYLYAKSTSLFKKQKFVGVLMYHSVEKSKWKYGVSPEMLEKQLKYLTEKYTVVSVDDILSYIKGEKTLSDKSIAVTFDDGYKDTYTEVFPRLKKYKIPATLFLTTNLEQKSKLGNFERPNWKELKEMQESGLVDIQVHGHNHKNLIQELEDKGSLREELLTSQKEIENNLGTKATLLAYASGHKNHSVIREVRRLGFEAGFDINEGTISRKTDIYRVPRIQIDRTMNFLLFKLRLTPGLMYNRRIIDTIRYGKK